MSINQSYDQVDAMRRPVVLPRSILPGRKEHFQTFPPPAESQRNGPAGPNGSRHSRADITSPVLDRPHQSRPTHFSAPSSTRPGHPNAAHPHSDPNVSVAPRLVSVAGGRRVDEGSPELDVTERIHLDLTERVTVTPPELRASPQHDSFTAAGNPPRANRLIGVLLGIAVLALVCLAFAMGFIVGERQDSGPKGRPVGTSLTAAGARTSEPRTVIQQ